MATEAASSDMVEMQEILSERHYNEEAGKVLLPQAF